MVLDIISTLTKLTRKNVYFDQFDNKWHIKDSYKWFDTEEEALQEILKAQQLDILQSVAETLNLNYGYDGKKIEIYL